MARDPYSGQSTLIGPLFDRPRARSSDPETSHIAAARHRESGRLNESQIEALRRLREYEALYGSPATCHELARKDPETHKRDHDDYAELSRRMSELERAGFVTRLPKHRDDDGQLRQRWEIKQEIPF